MHITRKYLAAILVALTTVVEAAEDPSITQAAAAILRERQVPFSSVDFISCAISSGLAVPQPSGASCGLASATMKASATQLIKTYTDVDSTASYIACSQTCLETSGCTQIFFAAGSTCSLYSGPRLYVKGTSNLTYYDLACFECVPTPLSTTSSSATKASTPTLAKIPTTTTTTKTTRAAAPSSVTPPTTPAVIWTSVQTNPESYNMALTTVFTPPPECTGSFTQIGTQYWQDAILPAPHTTVTSCYPSQLFSSAVGAANSVSLPPFNPLVCPAGWSSIPYNSTYIACCPDGWPAAAPNLSDVRRPLLGVVCYSLINRGILVDVTSYDLAGSATVLPLTVGSQGEMLLATGFEGIIGVGAPPESTTTAAAAFTYASSDSHSTTINVGGAARNLQSLKQRLGLR